MIGFCMKYVTFLETNDIIVFLYEIRYVLEASDMIGFCMKHLTY